MDPIHTLFSEAHAFVMHDLCMAKKALDPVAIECGKRLAACREGKGLTQAELAKLTKRGSRRGLSPSQIANFEQGTRRIRFEQAEILASIFTNFLPGYFMNALTERECRVLLAMRAEDDPLQKAV